MAGEYWLAMRADGFRGEGKASDPWDASSPSLFNSVMVNIATINPQGQVCIHIGPGIFQVPAFRGDIGAWRPGKDWRIVGAGRRATILKVVGAAGNNYPRVQCAIGVNGWYEYAEGFTIEDLTIDCNMRGHAGIGCSTGALELAGSRTKVRRIRVVDFGTETHTNECFPVFTAGSFFPLPEPRNCEISDCIAEKPSPNNIRETTVLSFANQEYDEPAEGIRGVMAYHRSCAMRNNRIDCDYSVDQRQIREITFAGISATAKTFRPHNRKAGDWVIISGALVVDSLINPFNGSFQVTSVSSGHEFSYTMPSVPSAEPMGTMWLGRFPCQAIKISGMSQQAAGGSWIITLTTAASHFRIPGQNVKLQNVMKVSFPGVPSTVNGVHRVIDVLSPTALRFVVITNPDNDWSFDAASIGVSFQGFSIDGGTGALAEHNRILGAPIGGPYHDTWHSKDILVQNNYYYATHSALYQHMGAFSGWDSETGLPTRPATSLIRQGSDFKTARLTCGFIHGLVKGQGIVIAKAAIAGNLSNPFNGNFLVDTVPTPTSLTYRMTAAPTANADEPPISPPPVFGGIWQTGRIIYYRNIVEQITNPLGTGAPPNGLALSSVPGLTSHYIFRELIAKGNRIRNMDGGSDPLSLGVYAYWVENSIVERNTLSGVGNSPIGYNTIGNVSQFNNQNQAGQVLQGVLYSPNFLSSTLLNQLETEADFGSMTVMATPRK